MNVAEAYNWMKEHPTEELECNDRNRYKFGGKTFRYWSNHFNRWERTSEFDRTFTIPEPAMVEVDLLTAMEWSWANGSSVAVFTPIQDPTSGFYCSRVDGYIHYAESGEVFTPNKNDMSNKYLIPEGKCLTT